MKQTAALVLLMCLALPQVANAAKESSPKSVVTAVSPSRQNAPLPPPPAKPQPERSNFPALPPSNPCTAKELRGMFRLVAVHEEPAGAETSGFKASPNQYLLFRRDSIFARLNQAPEGASPKAIYQEMKKHSTGLLQFQLQDNGFVYYYQNSVATEVQVCFVVATDVQPFKKGQILLMPPKGQITGRLVKVYQPFRKAKPPGKGKKK